MPMIIAMSIMSTLGTVKMMMIIFTHFHCLRRDTILRNEILSPLVQINKLQNKVNQNIAFSIHEITQEKVVNEMWTILPGLNLSGKLFLDVKGHNTISNITVCVLILAVFNRFTRSYLH